MRYLFVGNTMWLYGKKKKKKKKKKKTFWRGICIWLKIDFKSKMWCAIENHNHMCQVLGLVQKNFQIWSLTKRFSCYWQNFNFSKNYPKFNILTKIITLKVWLERDRLTLFTLKMLRRDVQRIYFFFSVVMSPSKACVSNHIIDSLLRGKGTLNQNLSCFIISYHLKIISIFFLNDTWILKQIVWKLKNEISVGPSVFKLLIKSCQIFFDQ